MMHAFELDDELTPDQKNDLRILTSLRGSEEIQEWMAAVDWFDVAYGISLMEIAAIKELEQETIYDPCIDAKIALSNII
jgi:hypothetical protein